MLTINFLYPATLYALFLLPALLALPFVGRRVVASRAAGFWAALALRAGVLLGVVLGLAGMQLVRPVHATTVVFVLDHSDSISPAEQKRAEDFVRAALAGLQPGDRAAIVVFGENALVDRLASEDKALAPVVSIPRTTRTNVAAALRLALALFPEETHKRIVLLSDGLENVGRAADLVELAAARGVQIDVVPSNPLAGHRVYVDSLQAPAAVRQGQSFELVAVIRSTLKGPAVLRLFGDGKRLATRDEAWLTGDERVSFSLTAEQAGFHRYEVDLAFEGDPLLQDNRAAAFTVVYGPPRVLVVENTPGEADNLLAALESSNIEAGRVMPAELPGDLAGLSSYDAVFLVNVPAKALPDAAMKTLPAYVRELGRGLVMIGGPQSYGAGGYLRTELEKALPVDMDVRSRTHEPNLALVFVIDKSGSMGRCHCDNPDALPGQYVRAESGLSKIDIAKDAVLQSTSLLGRTDYVGVVAFDSNALWALRVQELVDPGAVQQYIGGLRADGQTNLYAGLSEAEAALAQTPARLKHIILLTDGWSRSGEFDALARTMQDEGISLSIVAAGGGSATYLKALAESGGGRYYAAPTMTDVPQLFFKETIEAVGSYIVEEPFYPLPAGTTPILRGLNVADLPGLYGYNGTTPKASANVALVSARGDPLLATWQYGLGRAVAWTSDAKGQWAGEWVAWDEFNTFVAQLTNWVMPQPADEGLQVAISSDGAQTVVEVDSRSADGRPRDFLDTRVTVVGPDWISQTVSLDQVGPGRYRGELPDSEPGTYLLQVMQWDVLGEPVASSTAGWVVPYSPEYKLLDSAASVLPALAETTGGQVLAEPGLAFAPVARPATHAQPIWPWLLLAAALLFPLDVAARRLRLAREDWQTLLAWLRLPFARRPAAARPRVLGALFAARDRARRARAARDLPGDEMPAVAGPAMPPPPAEAGPTAPPASPEEMAGRLKQARDRARKSR